MYYVDNIDITFKAPTTEALWDGVLKWAKVNHTEIDGEHFVRNGFRQGIKGLRKVKFSFLESGKRMSTADACRQSVVDGLRFAERSIATVNFNLRGSDGEAVKDQNFQHRELWPAELKGD